MQDMTTQVKISTGAVRKVYTPDGKKIKGIDEFEDEGKYICCGAEALMKDSCNLHFYTLSLTNPSLFSTVPLALTHHKEKKEENHAPSPSKVTKPKTEKEKVQKEKKPISRFGTQSEKAKVIYVFRYFHSIECLC